MKKKFYEICTSTENFSSDSEKVFNASTNFSSANWSRLISYVDEYKSRLSPTTTPTLTTLNNVVIKTTLRRRFIFTNNLRQSFLKLFTEKKNYCSFLIFQAISRINIKLSSLRVIHLSPQTSFAKIYLPSIS